MDLVSPPRKRQRLSDVTDQASTASPSLSQLERAKRAQAIEHALRFDATAPLRQSVVLLGSHGQEQRASLMHSQSQHSRVILVPRTGDFEDNVCKRQILRSPAHHEEQINSETVEAHSPRSDHIDAKIQLPSESVDESSSTGVFISANGGKRIQPSLVAIAKAELQLSRWTDAFEAEQMAVSMADNRKEDCDALPGVRPPLLAIDNNQVHSAAPDSDADSVNGLSAQQGPTSCSPIDSSRLPHVQNPLYVLEQTPDNHANKQLLRQEERNKKVLSKGSVKWSLASATPSPSRGKAVGLSRTPRKTNFRTPFQNAPTPLQHATHPARLSASLPIGEAHSQAWAELDHPQLKRSSKCVSLENCGLVPRSYSLDAMREMNIAVNELLCIDPVTAIHHEFLLSTNERDELGLLAKENFHATSICKILASRKRGPPSVEWVNNAWGLILWKLAGLVLLDPQKEMGTGKRWHWREVLEQMERRYDREFGTSARSCLQRIAAQDGSAAAPMVLCVSNITWSSELHLQDGSMAEKCPDVEITDGWYRMRASIDQVLTRAIRRGHLRVGMKLACCGARLATGKKEPSEILRAYHSTELVIKGNTTHPAPWHMKLGFQRETPVATLHSLSPDGGSVSIIHVSVLKIFPLAFLEIMENENGNEVRLGPWDEKEEELLSERWKGKRECTAFEITRQLESRLSILEDLHHRSSSGTSMSAPAVQDSTVDIDQILDDVESSGNVRIALQMAGVHRHKIAALASDRIQSLRDSFGVEIEKGLDDLCPPRKVRNFQVMRVKDVCCQSKSSFRTAQISVWGARELNADEESSLAGGLRVGVSYKISNLQPTHQNAWMRSDEVDAEIFLATSYTSRFSRTS